MDRTTWGALGARPLVFPALALGVGAALGGLSPGASPWALLGVALVLGLVGARASSMPGAHLLMLLGFGLLGAGLARLQSAAPPALTAPANVLLEGRVLHAQLAQGRCRLVLETLRWDGRPTRARVRLSLREADACPLPGAQVRVPARAAPLEPAANPGQPDLRPRWLRAGITHAASAKSQALIVLAQAPAWQRWMATARARLREDTVRLAPNPEAAALFLTLAAGERAELGEELEATFSASGLAHVLSVSGLHVAALALVLLAVLRTVFTRLPLAGRAVEPRRIAAPLAIPLVWGFVAFTGWQAPAVRSALMASAALLGLSLRRPVDGLNTLAAAALLLIALDPACIADLSMQLSFLAVLSLVLLVPALSAWLPHGVPAQEATGVWRRWLHRAKDTAAQSLAASVAVTLVGAPLIAEAFGRISLAGLVSNIACMPLCGLLTLLAAGGAGLHAVWPVAAVPLLWVGGWASEGLLLAARFFASLPFASLPVPPPAPGATGVFALGLLGFALASGRARWLGLLAPLALAWTALLPVVRAEPALRITFLSVGQGDGIVVSSRGQHALIDAGGVPNGIDTGSRFVLPFLRSQGIDHLDLVALSHPHPDHALGLIPVLQRVRASRLWLAAGTTEGALSEQVSQAARDGGAQVEAIEAGREPLRLGEAVIEVLGPPRDRALLEGVNDTSLVLRIRHGAVTVLLTGDIEAAAEELLEVDPVTVLKAPHHGSRTSSGERLLDRTRPRAVVMSLGRHNRYGFPHAEVLSRYEARDIPIYRTDRMGAVTLESDGLQVRFSTWLPEADTLPRVLVAQ